MSGSCQVDRKGERRKGSLNRRGCMIWDLEVWSIWRSLGNWEWLEPSGGQQRGFFELLQLRGKHAWGRPGADSAQWPIQWPKFKRKEKLKCRVRNIIHWPPRRPDLYAQGFLPIPLWPKLLFLVPCFSFLDHCEQEEFTVAFPFVLGYSAWGFLYYQRVVKKNGLHFSYAKANV